MNVTIANRVKLAATIVCTAILVYILFVSRDHITDTAHMMGLVGYTASTLFILIDIPALLGKVLSTKYFAKSTRSIGFRLMLVSGSLSLVCNVLAGHNVGQRVYGAFIIGLFVGLEQVVTRIKPAAAVKAAATKAAKAAPAPAAPAAAPKRAAKCADGCTCGKHNRRKAGEVTNPVSPGQVDLAELNASMAA